MATKPITLNPLTTQTHKSCCDKFLAGLQQIKQWACTFFQWLFCCKPSEKPLPPARVQPPPPTQTEPTLTKNQEEEQRSVDLQAVAPSQPAVRQPVLSQARAFIGRYCERVAERAQEKGFLDTLHGEIVKILLNPEDQFFLLQQLASNDYVGNWPHMIKYLPDDLKDVLITRLKRQNNLNPHMSHPESLLTDPLYTGVDQLVPAFTAIVFFIQREWEPTPPKPVEQFTQEMVVQFCGPPGSAKFKLTKEHEEQFKHFTKKQQAAVMYTLLTLQMLDSDSSEDDTLFNDLVQPILNALFDLSKHQENPGTTPLAGLAKTGWYELFKLEIATQ